MLMQFREDENGDTTTESGSLEVWQLRSEELSGGVRPEQWFRRGMRRELAKKVDSSPVLEEAELQKPRCRKCLEALLEPPKLDPGRSPGLPLGHFA